MHLIWNDCLYIEASEIYLLLCVFIENCAVLTNRLLLLLDTPDRFFSPPILSVSRSTNYFRGGKRIRTKTWKKTWLVNFHHQLYQGKIDVYDFLSYFFTCIYSCPTFFTCTYFSFTLLPSTHLFCSRDHLLQILLMPYTLWLDSSSLTTQEKTVPVWGSLRIYTQLRDVSSKIYFCLIIH